MSAGKQRKKEEKRDKYRTQKESEKKIVSGVLT